MAETKCIRAPELHRRAAARRRSPAGPNPTRELREAGLAEPEARDLAELAAELASLPGVAPRRTWLIESTWRLLHVFDRWRRKWAV